MGLTGLQPGLFNWQDLEFYGRVSFMKAGLVFANMLSTVSPTYAREIQTEKFGCGLDGLLRRRDGDLRGIVNGIDPRVWAPRNEPMLVEPYDASTVQIGKPACKAWLQAHAGLPIRPDVPIFAQIGRLDAQKGWELLAQVSDRLLERDVQLVVLGTGHPHYHELLTSLVGRYPEKVWAHLGFSEELAHQIEAGADIFLMPSLFEPCGLTQLYSLAHGTVPIARATGGLADTVVDASPENQARETANGFLFRAETPDALWGAIDRALALWENRDAWTRLMQTGMRDDWSWDRSAQEYVKLYAEVLARVGG
jgi:starch synthase